MSDGSEGVIVEAPQHDEEINEEEEEKIDLQTISRRFPTKRALYDYLRHRVS